MVGSCSVANWIANFRVTANFADGFDRRCFPGRPNGIDGKRIDEVAKRLKSEGSCRSNDQHVIALAQLSGARLLYSNDRNLNHDFVNPELVPQPTGRVYTTLDLENRAFTPVHKKLLDRKDMCPRDSSQRST